MDIPIQYKASMDDAVLSMFKSAETAVSITGELGCNRLDLNRGDIRIVITTGKSALDIPNPRFGEPVGNWYRHFCWLPVRTWDQRLKWLCFTERQAVQRKVHIDGGPDWWFRYRTLEAGRASQASETGK